MNPRGQVSSRPQREHLRVRAFTLIEIMLALAIFAGVLAAIYSSWYSILRGTRVALAAAEEAQRSRIGVRVLEDSLACAKLFPANARYYGFVADTSEETAFLSFVARLPESFPRGGRFVDRPMRRLTFSTASDPEGGLQLELRQTPVLFEPEPDEEEHPLVIARGVDAFLLQFWGANSREWEDVWRLTNQLPRMVKFTLATRAGGSHGGPPRVVTRVVLMPGAMASGVAPQPGNLPLPNRTNALPPVRTRNGAGSR